MPANAPAVKAANILCALPFCRILSFMSASYICPHCGKAVTVKSVPVDNCPFCGEAAPDSLAKEIERTYVPPRPLSLTFQMWCGFIFGAMMALAIPDAFGPPDDSVYKLISQSFNMDFPAPPHLPPIMAGLLCIVQVFILFWSSYSLYMHEYQSRSLIMLLIFAFTVPETVLTAPLLAGSDLGRLQFLSKAFTCIISLILCYWYLYHWKFCKYYYESIRYLSDKANPPADGAAS
jgi:hypothetical protein